MCSLGGWTNAAKVELRMALMSSNEPYFARTRRLSLPRKEFTNPGKSGEIDLRVESAGWSLANVS